MRAVTYKPLPSLDDLNDLFEDRGDHWSLYWKRHPKFFNLTGRRSGSIVSGYISVIIHGQSYKAHRLLFKMRNGFDPPDGMQVDHVGGLKILDKKTGKEYFSNKSLKAKYPSGNNYGRYGIEKVGKPVKKLPSRKKIKRLLRYYPDIGEFYWRKNKHVPKNWRGRLAGGINKRNGYYSIMIDGRNYVRSNLALIYMGEKIDTNLVVDHINGNRSDDRYENLQQITPSQNSKKIKRVKKKKLKKKKGLRGKNPIQSKFNGVSFVSNKWQTVIPKSWFGKVFYVGLFETETKAVIARDVMALIYIINKKGMAISHPF